MRCLLPLVVTASLLGQQTNPAAQQPRFHQVDGVVATVNDSAILWSELMTVAAGRVRSLVSSGARLTRADEDQVLLTEREKLIDGRQMALSLKSLGVVTPDQVESLLRSELEREKQEKVRDLGSVPELSRALKEEGRTWPTYEREQRLGKLGQFAEEFAVHQRFQRNSSLLLTPRMLRETYEKQKDAFVHPAQATVAMVEFRGADAEARATRAAAAWAIQDLTSRDLASRHFGSIPYPEQRSSALADFLKPVAEFAEAGPTGHVSPPLACRDSWFVARVVEFHPAANGRFEDPLVQARLRLICQNRVLNEFRQQAMERAKVRTEVWRSPLIGR